MLTSKKILKQKQWRPPNKKEKKGKKLSPRNVKACHSVGTALLQSVAKIGTQIAMKRSRKTLHEFTSKNNSDDALHRTTMPDELMAHKFCVSKHTGNAIERSYRQECRINHLVLNVMKIEKNKFINHRSVASIP
jgi:hypothetical protein